MYLNIYFFFKFFCLSLFLCRSLIVIIFKNVVSQKLKMNTENVGLEAYNSSFTIRRFLICDETPCTSSLYRSNILFTDSNILKALDNYAY